MTFTVVNMMSVREIIGQSVYDFVIEINIEVGSPTQTREKVQQIDHKPYFIVLSRNSKGTRSYYLFSIFLVEARMRF